MPSSNWQRPRVIAGVAKGCKLETPPGLTTRPTPSRVREALFSSWQARGALGPGLDAFAGSGAIGIEALSRGAPFVYFVETDRAALGALRANIGRLPAAVAARAHVVAMPLATVLGQWATQGGAPAAPTHGPLTWVYADPPFAAGLYGDVLARCGEATAVLAATAELVLEHPAAMAMPAHAAWQIDRTRTFGRVALTFCRRA